MEGFDPQADYSDGAFEPIAEGRHIFCVTQARLRKSKKGSLMIEVRLDVIGDDPNADQRLWEYFLLEKGWFGKLATFCRAIDPDMKGSNQDPEGFEPTNQESVHRYLLGMPVAIDIDHREETYKGEKRIREIVRKSREDGWHYWSITPEEEDVLARKYDRGGQEIVPELPDDAEELHESVRGGRANDSSTPF